MKKYISLHTQNIIKFIPFLNFSILFIWLFNYSCTEKDLKVFMKSLVIIFGVSVPIAILHIIISKLLTDFSVIQSIFNGIFMYLIPFIIGSALIKYQKIVM